MKVYEKGNISKGRRKTFKNDLGVIVSSAFLKLVQLYVKWDGKNNYLIFILRWHQVPLIKKKGRGKKKSRYFLLILSKESNTILLAM